MMDIDGAAIITIIVRLIAPLLILRFPLVGTLLNALLDALDYRFIGGYDWYDRVDKSLDTYYLSFSAYTVLRWQDAPAKVLAIGSYLFRLVGVVIFLIVGTPEILFVFPNFFEHFFVFYLVYVRLAREDTLLTSYAKSIPIVAVLMVIKLFQEFVVHVYPPDHDRVPQWLHTILQYPISWTILALHIPALILLAYLVITKRRQKYGVVWPPKRR
jgi:hypothetical protein